MTSQAKGLKDHPVVPYGERIAVRCTFFAKEKEFTRQKHELNRPRHELSWERVEKEYVFDGPIGPQEWGRHDGRYED